MRHKNKQEDEVPKSTAAVMTTPMANLAPQAVEFNVVSAVCGETSMEGLLVEAALITEDYKVAVDKAIGVELTYCNLT